MDELQNESVNIMAFLPGHLHVWQIALYPYHEPALDGAMASPQIVFFGNP